MLKSRPGNSEFLYLSAILWGSLLGSILGGQATPSHPTHGRRQSHIAPVAEEANADVVEVAMYCVLRSDASWYVSEQVATSASWCYDTVSGKDRITRGAADWEDLFWQAGLYFDRRGI